MRKYKLSWWHSYKVGVNMCIFGGVLWSLINKRSQDHINAKLRKRSESKGKCKPQNDWKRKFQQRIKEIMCKSVDNFKGTAKVTSTSQRGNLKGSIQIETHMPHTKIEGQAWAPSKIKGKQLQAPYKIQWKMKFLTKAKRNIKGPSKTSHPKSNRINKF